MPKACPNELLLVALVVLVMLNVFTGGALGFIVGLLLFDGGGVIVTWMALFVVSVAAFDAA